MAAGEAGAKRTPTSFPPRPTRGRACREFAEGTKEGIEQLERLERLERPESPNPVL
jgi:hypothetical protein